MDEPKFDPNKPYQAVQTPTFDPNQPYKPLGPPGADPGMLEALLRGGEQGLTFGFGDEINGGLSTLADTLSGKNKDLSLLEDYRKQRDESRANMEAAEQAHPYISGAGNFAGALIPALLTGGGSAAASGAAEGSALARAATTGAKIGAVAGLGNSKADLTEGDVGNSLRDIVAGGAGGALVGGALHGATRGLQKAGGLISELKTVSEPAEAFRQGAMENRLLLGKGANRKLQQDILDKYNTFEPALQKAQGLASADKTNMLIKGKEADMFPWLKGFNESVDSTSKNAGADKSVLNELSRLKDYVSRYFTGASDEEGNQILQGKLTDNGSLSAEDLDRFRAKLATWSAQGDESFKTPEVRTLVTRLLSSIEGRDPSLLERSLGLPEGFQGISGAKGILNTANPGLNDLNSRISQLQKAKEGLPSLNQVLNSEKSSQSGTTALDALQDFLKVAPKDVLGSSIDEIQGLAKAKDIANSISAPNMFHRTGSIIADTGKGALLGGANLAGLGARWLYDASPEALQNIAKQIATVNTSAAGQRLSTMLGNASQKDNIGRNALFFAIQQNPEYRKILAESTHNSEEQK